MALRVIALLLMIVAASAGDTVTDTITTVTTTSETTTTQTTTTETTTTETTDTTTTETTTTETTTTIATSTPHTTTLTSSETTTTETTTTETTTTDTTTTETTTTETTTTFATSTPHTTTLTSFTTPTPCLRAFDAMDEALFDRGGACVPIGGTCPAECRQVLDDLFAECGGQYMEDPLGDNFSASFFALLASAFLNEMAGDALDRRLSDMIQHFSDGLGRRLIDIDIDYYEEFEARCTDIPLLAVFDNDRYEPTCQDVLQIFVFLGQPLCGAPGQCSELCGLLTDNVFRRCHAESAFGELFAIDNEDIDILPNETAGELLSVAPLMFSENCSALLEDRALAPNATALLEMWKSTTTPTTTADSQPKAESTSQGNASGTDEEESPTGEAELDSDCAARSVAAPALVAAILAALLGGH